jgi:outer membrane protein TolC
MRLFLCLPLLAAIPGMAFAGPLTFEAALQRARQEAPSIKAKSLGADAARSARGAAGALPDPTLGVSVESFPISGPLAFEPQRDDFTMARVGVSQDIPNLAKRHAQQARADSDIKAAEADTAVEARTVEVGTALAWINLAYSERRLAALDDVLSRLERVVETTPGAVASGNARPAQTLAGQQAVAAMQDRRSELVSNVARARATLTRWTGDPAPEIAGPIPDFAVHAAALREGLDRQPTIRMIEAQAGQADADVRLADAGRRSDFGVNLAYQRRDPRFGDYVSAGVRPMPGGYWHSARPPGARSPQTSMPISPTMSCITSNGCARGTCCSRSPNSASSWRPQATAPDAPVSSISRTPMPHSPTQPLWFLIAKPWSPPMAQD